MFVLRIFTLSLSRFKVDLFVATISTCFDHHIMIDSLINELNLSSEQRIHQPLAHSFPLSVWFDAVGAANSTNDRDTEEQ